MIIGKIPFLNCVPFFNYLDAGADEIVAATPRRLAEMLARGELDAGPIPAVEWFALKDEYALLDGWGIISDGPSHSVFLYSKKPFSELNGETIYLTEQSLCSIALLKYLCARENISGVQWIDGGAPGDDDARLLIGDAAMAARENLEARGFVAIDLSDAWKTLTGLPFTFAVWVIKKSIPEEEAKILSDRIRASHDKAMLNIDSVAAEQQEVRELPAGLIKHYLRSFVFKHNERSTEGMGLFEREFKRGEMATANHDGR